MVIAVIVVALAMIVGGATAIITGAESIVLERGWSAVIAGSIVATGGALLFALALLLHELQRLPQRLETVAPDAQEPWRDAPHVDAPVVAPVLAAAPFSAETIQSLEPRDVTPPLARDEAPVAAVERAERLPRRPVSRVDPVEATVRTVSAEPRFEPTPQVVPEAYVVPEVVAGPSAPAQERQKEPELRAERETGRTSAPEPVSEPKAEEPVVPVIGAAEMMRSVFPDFSPRDRIAPVDAKPVVDERKPPDVGTPVDEAAPVEEAPAPAAAEPPIEEPELALNPDKAAVDETPVVKPEQKSGPAALVEPEPPSGPAAEDKQEHEPAHEPAQEPADVTPTVVGTYSSGGNVYVMYADGSIEADTPDGVFRFGSLDELKAYIASGSQGHGATVDKRRPSPVI